MPGVRKVIFSRLDGSSTGNGPVVRVRVVTLTCHHCARGLLRYSRWLFPFPDVVTAQDMPSRHEHAGYRAPKLELEHEH